MQTIRRVCRSDFAPAAALLIAGVLGIMGATVNPSSARGEYAVVAPPWYDLGETALLIRRAGGLIDGVGGFSNIVIVRSKDPMLASALYRAGAWLVVDPMGPWGCSASTPNPARSGGRS